MTIKELYEWAKEKELENCPILISKGKGAENLIEVEVVDEDSIFNGVFFRVDTKTIILK
jgi:hypothetical protein